MGNAYQTAHKLIESHFKTYWESLAAELRTPIEFANVNFTQPGSGEWIRFAVRFNDGVQASLGSDPREFISGVVFVQIFQPKGIGERRANVLADAVAAGLRYGQLSESGVVVDVAAPSQAEAGERADCYQKNVTAEFRIQHITTVAN